MQINRARAHEVIDTIDNFHREPIDGAPRGFDMSLWYAEHGVGFQVPESQQHAIECRTSACLAGWTVTILDSADKARELMGTQTNIYGGIGELFMHNATHLLEADDEAGEVLHELFCKLSYTWEDARAEFANIIDNCEDVGE